jgi:TolB-like protein
VSSKHIAIVRGGTGMLVVGNEPRRRPSMPSLTGVYQFGPFQLDASERRLLRDGVQVPLRLKAFETLRMLVENAGHLVTKEALLQQVWPDAMVEENNINANVSILRKALGEDANGQSYIETVPRVGYRFVAQVAQVFSPQSAPTTSGDPAPELEPEKSVAVLYFENLSGDKEDEYFRDGMTEDVITELAKIKDLRLFPRSAVLVFRDKPLPVTEVGQQLRAAFVLEGSVRRAGSRLRITARLAETRTGHSVWAERYDRQLEDVFAIQDEIAQNIARALRVMLSDQEKRKLRRSLHATCRHTITIFVVARLFISFAARAWNLRDRCLPALLFSTQATRQPLQGSQTVPRFCTCILKRQKTICERLRPPAAAQSSWTQNRLKRTRRAGWQNPCARIIRRRTRNSRRQCC